MKRQYRRLLYNGTTVKAALSIEEEGVKPGTYFTPSRERAARYAVAVAENRRDEPAVVAVRVPSDLLHPDPMERGSYVNVRHIPVEFVLGWESVGR